MLPSKVEAENVPALRDGVRVTCRPGVPDRVRVPLTLVVMVAPEVGLVFSTWKSLVMRPQS